MIAVWSEGAFGIIKTALYLDRLALMMTGSRSRVDCLHQCLQQSRCISANFWPGHHLYNGICILNAATVDEYRVVIATPPHLYHGISVTDWVYLELLN